MYILPNLLDWCLQLASLELEALVYWFPIPQCLMSQSWQWTPSLSSTSMTTNSNGEDMHSSCTRGTNFMVVLWVGSVRRPTLSCLVSAIRVIYHAVPYTAEACRKLSVNLFKHIQVDKHKLRWKHKHTCQL